MLEPWTGIQSFPKESEMEKTDHLSVGEARLKTVYKSGGLSVKPVYQVDTYSTQISIAWSD